MGGGRGRTGNAGGKGGAGGAGAGGMGDPTTMNDQQLADFVLSAMNVRIPSNLNADDPTQRLIYAMNWNDKPDIVSADKAESLARQPGAVVLYRTVNANNNLSAKEIVDFTLKDGVFKISDVGGRLAGGGLYFADSANASRKYGRGEAFTIGAVLNKKAKIVDIDDLYGSTGSNWLSKHPKTAQSLGFKMTGGQLTAHGDSSRGITADDRYSSLAAVMGYNVVKARLGRRHYYMVLNRKVLTTSNRNYYGDGNSGPEMN